VDGMKQKETDESLREAFDPDGQRILATLNQRYEPGASWQETDLPGGWTVREDLAPEDGRRIVTSLTIRPTKAGAVPTGGVTARLLRLVKVGQFASGLRQTLAKFYGADAATRIFDGIGWASRPRRRKRPARLRADDRYYAELARDYVELGQTGERKPTAALAAARGVPDDVMRSHIHLARKNGFLTETGRGKAGGELTARARRALARKAVGKEHARKKEKQS
jgi:hypothetical protein